MSDLTFHGETMSPLFGHATEWTLTYEGRPVHVFMHNPHHETPQLVITAMDTHRRFRQTSKRGRGIVALIRDAYAQRFAGLHFDDADAEPEFGYICKHCHGPAPVGIGYVADGADAAARSEGLTACECGYSTTDVEEETMTDQPADLEPAQHTAEDSLIYINRAVSGLLDLAENDIHGVYHLEHATDTEELPEHLAEAVDVLKTAARIIRAETTFHGLNRRRFYSTGTPTTGTYQEQGAEPQDDGTHRIVMHDVVFDRYPDGQQNHPLFRDAVRGSA